MPKLKTIFVVVLVVILAVAVIGILSSKPVEEPAETPQQEEPSPVVTREDKIPSEAVKQTPGSDQHPPVLHSFLWEDPVPVPGGVNTAGAEDSPFVSPDDQCIYFFFTPDVSVPPEKQLLDKVTGIWFSEKVDGEWADAERLWLIDDGLSLDGCEYVSDDEIWFMSVRVGNMREIDLYIADLTEEGASNVRSGGEELNLEVGLGEFHVSPDGQEIYFHSMREDGLGSMDVWMTEWTGDGWSDPVNVGAVNSQESEGYPYLTPDMGELWINKWYMGSPGTWRSKWIDGEWSEPQLIVSSFAGEPNLDSEGNIYFVHHYYKDGVMLEADIYIAYRKPQVEPSDEAFAPDRGYLMGYLPTPAEGQGFDDVYAWTSDSCDIVPVWGKPSPFWEKAEDLDGAWGETFVEQLVRDNDMAPLVHFSFIGEDMTLSTPPGTAYTMSDTEWRLMYKRAVIEAVEASRPRYLSIGNEVNRWYETHGLEGANGFTHWVSLYEEIYDEVKELSPETQVFCTFSREIVSENIEADMTVLDLFDPAKLDILVLTSYPHSVQGINRPGDIPADYYSRVANRMPGKPFGFSEIAWPSMDAFGGEQAQAEFIASLPGLTTGQGVDLKLLMWSWLHDLGKTDYTGLVSHDGVDKEGLTTWMDLYSMP